MISQRQSVATVIGKSGEEYSKWSTVPTSLLKNQHQNCIESKTWEKYASHRGKMSMWEYKRFRNAQFIIQIKNKMAGLQNHFNPFAFTNCICIGLAVFAFKALKIPCLFAFSGGKTQKCKYYYWNCCNSKSLQLTSYKFHTMYVKTLHYTQMLINVYEIYVLIVKI